MDLSETCYNKKWEMHLPMLEPVIGALELQDYTWAQPSTYAGPMHLRRMYSPGHIYPLKTRECEIV